MEELHVNDLLLELKLLTLDITAERDTPVSYSSLDQPPLLTTPLKFHALNSRLDNNDVNDGCCNYPLSIFLGNIPSDITREVLMWTCQAKGTVIELICEISENKWRTAFISFSCHEEAFRTVEAFHSRQLFPMSKFPHRVVACFAPKPAVSSCHCGLSAECLVCSKIPPFQPKFDYRHEYRNINKPMKETNFVCKFSLLRDGPAGANLFIYGLPTDWTEVLFLRLCQEFGHVVGIRVPTTGETSKGFGFVSYDSVQSTNRALEGLNGRLIGGKPLNVQLKAKDQYPSEGSPSHPRRNAFRRSVDRACKRTSSNSSVSGGSQCSAVSSRSAREFNARPVNNNSHRPPFHLSLSENISKSFQQLHHNSSPQLKL